MRQGNYAEWRKPTPQGDMLYDYIHPTCLKWQWISDSQGSGVGSMWLQTQGIFVVMEQSCILIVVVATWIYIYDKNAENYTYTHTTDTTENM